jgi:hypothetical protein
LFVHQLVEISCVDWFGASENQMDLPGIDEVSVFVGVCILNVAQGVENERLLNSPE